MHVNQADIDHAKEFWEYIGMSKEDWEMWGCIVYKTKVVHTPLSKIILWKLQNFMFVNIVYDVSREFGRFILRSLGVKE